MIKLIRRSRMFSVGLVFIAILLVATTVILTSKITFAASNKQSEEGRLITIYDRGAKKTVLSQAETVGDVLKETGIKVSSQDLVEPEQNEKLVASSYKINIYRARPVIIIDGNIRLKIVTPYQTAEQIAKSAGITIYPEDETTIDRVDNLVEGAGLQLTIKRATPITFVLYGKVTALRTRATTVGEMLKEKGIKLAADDTLSVPASQSITSGETIELWRNGKQTINVDEDIPFVVKQTQAMDQPVGYSKIQTPGVLGKKTITYEVEMKNGVEISRTEIQSVTITQPTGQNEIIGTKPIYPTGTANPTGNKAIGKQMLLSNGFDISQWGCLESLWDRESGWNQYDVNPNSGAFGIPQGVPLKGRTFPSGFMDGDVIAQISWGLSYIKSSYVNPCKAWEHSNKFNWY